MPRVIEKFAESGSDCATSSRFRPSTMRRRLQNPVLETMELLIVRHAIAFERDDHRWRDDGARPLSPAGMRRARKRAARLKEVSHAAERLLTRPLGRAQANAPILTGRGRLAL